MSHPIHSVKYVKKRYKTHQFVSVLFAAITIVAASLAAITGFRITQIHNRQKEFLSQQRLESSNADQLKAEITTLKKESIAYQKQLASEKSQVKSLSARIEALEKQLNMASRPTEVESVPTFKATPKTTPGAAGIEASTPRDGEVPEPGLLESNTAAEPGSKQPEQALESDSQIVPKDTDTAGSAPSMKTPTIEGSPTEPASQPAATPETNP